jgi:DNA-binding protein WhiA
MSFTLDVKEQLLRINTSRRCCRQSEFLAFLRMNGNVSLASGGKPGLLATTSNAAVARRYFKLVKELWGLRAEILMRDSHHFKKNKIYTLRIPPQDEVRQVLDKLAKIPDGNPWNAGQDIGRATTLREVFASECCQRAYLRGAFLGSGFVSNPQKSYHLEIVCQDIYQAHFLLALAAYYQLNLKISERKGRFLVYCKGSEQISDFLNVIGAHSALLELENVRVIKDTSNNVNRIINCDTANTDKAVEAAQRQLAAIRRLVADGRLDGLKPQLRETAALRLENPDLPLAELAKLFEKPISKAGLYHRLQKLEALAEEI